MKDKILDDLKYASALAREGASSPLLGGHIGLLWGMLLCLTFSMQWAILSQTLRLPLNTLAYLWIVFAIVGGAGSMIIGRQKEAIDGAQSVANRTEKYVWTMFSAMLVSLFIGICLNIAFSNGRYELFGIMVAVGFAGQGLAYGVVALMSGERWIQLVSFASFVVSTLCVFAYEDAQVYLMGAVASLFTIVIPSLISIRKEAKHG